MNNNVFSVSIEMRSRGTHSMFFFRKPYILKERNFIKKDLVKKGVMRLHNYDRQTDKVLIVDLRHGDASAFTARCPVCRKFETCMSICLFISQNVSNSLASLFGGENIDILN